MATPTTGLTPSLSLPTDSLFSSNTGTGNGHIAFDPAPLKITEEQRNEIIDYIRYRMGDGMVDIEADREHFDMGIKQAFLRYRQRSSNSVEESYAFIELYPETQEYILPREIMNVRQIYRRGIGATFGATASQFEPFSSGYMNTYMLVAGRVGGLASYELFAGYQELAMRMFGGHIQFTFNPTTKKLVLTRKIPFQGTNFNQNFSESVLLHVDNQKPDLMLFNDQMAFPWIQDYAYALVKFSIGEAREKFGAINGPGGGTTLNGTAMKAEAKEMLDKLDEDIKNYMDGGSPLTFIIG